MRASTRLPSRQPMPFGPRHAPAPLQAVPPDLLGIVRFADAATEVIPLTPVIAPRLLQAPTTLQPGGCTNITAALRLALHRLRSLPRSTVRRLLLIGDGEPNRECDALVQAVAECRANWVSIDTIYCGSSGAGDAVLRSISGATVGGFHYTASTFEQLKEQVIGSAARPHRRHGATVIAVDCSSSMAEALPAGGQSRIGAAIAACQAAVLIRRTAFARVGGPR